MLNYTGEFGEYDSDADERGAAFPKDGKKRKKPGVCGVLICCYSLIIMSLPILVNARNLRSPDVSYFCLPLPHPCGGCVLLPSWLFGV